MLPSRWGQKFLYYLRILYDLSQLCPSLYVDCAIISFTLWYQCWMFIVHNFPFFIVNKTILSFCCRKMAFTGNLTEFHVNLSWCKWKEISKKKTRTNWHIVKLSFDILFEGLRELNTIWKVHVGKLKTRNDFSQRRKVLITMPVNKCKKNDLK